MYVDEKENQANVLSKSILEQKLFTVIVSSFGKKSHQVYSKSISLFISVHG